jgi:hypothetical protein
MAYTPLQNLIDKQDNFEIVRDQIGIILAEEVANQMTLAAAAVPAQDPEDYRLNVYLERSQAWEKFQNAPEPGTEDAAPIVNVWYDGSSFDTQSGDLIRSQKNEATYNIDVYGYAPARDDGATGQLPSDREAALECMRGVRLVRNILMASTNTRLQLPENFDPKTNPRIVSKRFFRSIRMYQPQINEHSIQGIWAARMAFVVEFIETSPQYEGEPCEGIDIELNLNLTEDGQVVTENVSVEFTP